MPLFATFGWVDTYINGMVDRQLSEWQVDMYAKNTYLHKIPQDRIDQKRQQLKRDAESKIYFWRKWWPESDYEEVGQDDKE